LFVETSLFQAQLEEKSSGAKNNSQQIIRKRKSRRFHNRGRIEINTKNLNRQQEGGTEFQTKGKV
jgi:hypothetical protein